LCQTRRVLDVRASRVARRAAAGRDGAHGRRAVELVTGRTSDVLLFYVHAVTRNAPIPAPICFHIDAAARCAATRFVGSALRAPR
jgi:hypothetical protein